MRKSCMKSDDKIINELCKKYGDDFRSVIEDTVMMKNAEFVKTHKPIYELKNYRKYYRHLIQLRPDVAMMVHLFKRDSEDSWESMWLQDNEAYSEEEYQCIKESAHQLLLQLEGYWCDVFIKALRDDCNEILENSECIKNESRLPPTKGRGLLDTVS